MINLRAFWTGLKAKHALAEAYAGHPEGPVKAGLEECGYRFNTVVASPFLPFRSISAPLVYSEVRDQDGAVLCPVNFDDRKGAARWDRYEDSCRQVVRTVHYGDPAVR